jgi:hypothetical protein
MRCGSATELSTTKSNIVAALKIFDPVHIAPSVQRENEEFAGTSLGKNYAVRMSGTLPGILLSDNAFVNTSNRPSRM